jgi:hypothetical protein
MKRILLLLIAFTYGVARSQDSDPLPSDVVADKYAKKIAEKTDRLKNGVNKYSGKALAGFAKLESRMRNKLSKVNPGVANQLFNYSIDSIGSLSSAMRSNRLLNKFGGRKYFAYLDTLKQTLAFIGKGKQALNQIQGSSRKLQSLSSDVLSVEDKLSNLETIESYLADRSAVLRDQLRMFPGLRRQFEMFEKKRAYFSQQVNKFKSIFSDPTMIEEVVLAGLRKLPAFNDFISRNSQLASIFALGSGSSGGGSSIPVVNGIPPRSSLQNMLRNSMASQASLDQMINQQLGAVQSAVDRLRDRVNSLGGNGSADLPEIQINQQRGKTFLQRLEYGTDLQFGKTTRFIPSNANIGFHVGYKLNNKSSAGVGAGYKLGFGSSWNKIRLSHEGISLRSYVSWKIKGRFFLRGASEWNYNHGFRHFDELKNVSRWQQSALLGISKQYQFSKKIKGNMQVLFNFLYKQTVPVSEPVVFRMGYGL